MSRDCRREYGADLHCIYADDNADQLVLRVRIRIGGDQPQDEDDDDASGNCSEERTVDVGGFETKRHPEGDESLHQNKKTNNILGPPALGNGRSGSWKPTVLMATVLADPDVDCTRTVSNDIVEICSEIFFFAPGLSQLHTRYVDAGAPGCESLRATPRTPSTLFHTGPASRAAGPAADERSYFFGRRLRELSPLGRCCATRCASEVHWMAISRHGINRGDSGPLLSASFEETVEVLFKSAIFARKDDVDGVTPNIMLGQLAHVGTGVSDLLLIRPSWNTPRNWKPRPAAERIPEGVGDASLDAFPARRGDDALRVVSGRFIRGFSGARRRDAGLGRRGLFSYCWWHSSVLSLRTARRQSDGASPAYGGVASPVYGGGWLRRHTRASRRPGPNQTPRWSSPFFTTQAYVTRLQCRPGVWNQPATSGRFPDCSFSHSVPSRPARPWRSRRPDSIKCLGSSIKRIGSLTVRSYRRPTSPAYSCGPGVLTQSRLGSGPSPLFFYAGLRHPRTVPPWRLESTNNLGPIP